MGPGRADVPGVVTAGYGAVMGHVPHAMTYFTYGVCSALHPIVALRHTSLSVHPPPFPHSFHVSISFHPITHSPQTTLTFTDAIGKLEVTLRATQAVDDLEYIALAIPFPKSVLSVSMTSPSGNIDYDDATKTLRWDLGRMPREKVAVISGTFTMPSYALVIPSQAVFCPFILSQGWMNGVVMMVR